MNLEDNSLWNSGFVELSKSRTNCECILFSAFTKYDPYFDKPIKKRSSYQSCGLGKDASPRLLNSRKGALKRVLG